MKKLWKMAGLNRSDLVFLAFVLAMIAALYGILWYFRAGEQETAKVAVVRYRDEEVMRLDLTVDGTYTYEATLGTVTIEVKDGAVRVEKETSPYHYCSLQGWVKESAVPIVCLPNDLMITIEGASGEGGNDVDIR